MLAQFGILAPLLLVRICFATTFIHLENPTGSVHVQSKIGVDPVTYTATSNSRPLRPADITETHKGNQLTIVCRSSDALPIDLTLNTSHKDRIEIVTRYGAISLSGLIAGARILTESGDVTVSAPWALTRLHAIASRPPSNLKTPTIEGLEFVTGEKEKLWALANSRPGPDNDSNDPIHTGWTVRWGHTFESVEIAATGPPIHLSLLDEPIPPGSWIQLPDTAPDVLDELHRRWSKRHHPATSPAPVKTTSASPPATSDFLFRSDVSLVTLVAAVYDQSGHPLPGLKAEEFALAENGHPETISFAHSGETPLNVVLLLDLSLSSFLNRSLIIEGARQFIESAQPADKIGINAFANGLFQVISPLSSDRTKLLAALNDLPAIDGDSPIYDSIVLSSGQEGLGSMGERSALVLLTDGMDNQLGGGHDHGGSQVPFDRLRKAAAEWPLPIYSIIVPYDHPAQQGKGRHNLQVLADASGGRTFPVETAADLSQAYRNVSEDLRSVYAIGYYPQNQNFDGAWREIHLEIKHPGVKFRVRPGYYAW